MPHDGALGKAAGGVALLLLQIVALLLIDHGEAVALTNCNEAEFHSELDACINRLGPSTRSHVFNYSFESKTSGLVSVLQLSLQMPAQLVTICSNLRVYKDCQDTALRRFQSSWSRCSWWQAKQDEYFYRFEGFFNGVCETNYSNYAHCISKQLDSYLARRCNLMFSLRNQLMASDECGLSNEYLGCLNALVATGCIGRVAEMRFRGVAPYLLGSAACRDRYDFARPGFAFAYDHPMCVPRFQEMLQKIRGDFLTAIGDPFLRHPYSYPILRSGSSRTLRTGICPALQRYESRSTEVKSRCQYGYNLIQATFDWRLLTNQLEFICDNIDSYSSSLACMRTANLRNCEHRIDSVNRLLFNHWQIRCTDYLQQRRAALRREWEATTQCLSEAMTRQCGAIAGQYFGVLVAMQNSERRYEINCTGGYQSLNFTVSYFVDKYLSPEQLHLQQQQQQKPRLYPMLNDATKYDADKQQRQQQQSHLSDGETGGALASHSARAAVALIVCAVSVAMAALLKYSY